MVGAVNVYRALGLLGVLIFHFAVAWWVRSPFCRTGVWLTVGGLRGLRLFADPNSYIAVLRGIL